MDDISPPSACHNWQAHLLKEESRWPRPETRCCESDIPGQQPLKQRPILIIDENAVLTLMVYAPQVQDEPLQVVIDPRRFGQQCCEINRYPHC
jgi:hypothetical protein